MAIVALLAGGIFAVAKSSSNSSDDKSGHSSDSTSPAQQPTEATTTAQSGEVAVGISDFKYSPQALVVKKGSTVTWTNQDDVGHDITSDSDSEKRGLASPLLSKGQTFSHTFSEVGTYAYHCKPHPYMTASVQVVE